MNETETQKIKNNKNNTHKMSITLVSQQPNRGCIKEALHDITEARWSGSADGEKLTHFYDALAPYLHIPDVFELPWKVQRVRSAIVYSARTHNGNFRNVYLQVVSTNFLNRILYDMTKLPVLSLPLFATLKLSGIPLPDQTMCCAAAADACTVSDGYSNLSKNRFSWCKLLLSMGFPITRNGLPIEDTAHNSILEIVSPCNVKYVLRALLNEGISTIQMSQSRLDKCCEMSKNSRSIRECFFTLKVTVK